MYLESYNACIIPFKVYIIVLSTGGNMKKIGTLPKLARIIVEEFVNTKKIPKIEKDILEDNLLKYFEERAGIFVTIHKKDGNLRGCIGTISPVQNNIMQEIIHNAISACSQDPRFLPVQIDELDNLVYSVSVLQAPEQIDSVDKLDPEKYGVIVASSFSRRGLLLPRLESIKTVQEQVYHAMAKGGIRPNEKISLYRFETVEYKEEDEQ